MRQPCGGFTLLELLIAIVLAAGITVAGTLLARTTLAHEGRHAERWTWQADIRNSRSLLEHYWKRRQQETYMLSSQSLLISLSEGEKQYFIGFACEKMDTGQGSFALYRWQAAHENIAHLGDAQAWPAVARQTLIDDLAQCRFSMLQPPPAEDREAVPVWTDRWGHHDKPEVLRFDVTSTNGRTAPPMITSAKAQ